MITSRCNMTCPHCVYACGKVGEDMSFETFKMAIDKWSPLLNRNKQSILIGGGEPTVHPQFWKFLDYARSKGRVWLATNGKKTFDFMMLAKLAKEEKIGVTLSQDQYHDPIDSNAVTFFKEGLNKKKNRPGYQTPMKNGFIAREIRTVVELRTGGRCRDGVTKCPCPRMHVKPNGDIYGCGCEDAIQIGTVKEGIWEKYISYAPQFRINKPYFRVCSKRWLPK